MLEQHHVIMPRFVQVRSIEERVLRNYARRKSTRRFSTVILMVSSSTYSSVHSTYSSSYSDKPQLSSQLAFDYLKVIQQLTFNSLCSIKSYTYSLLCFYTAMPQRIIPQ